MSSVSEYQVFKGELSDEEMDILVGISKKKRKVYLIVHICVYAAMLVLQVIGGLLMTVFPPFMFVALVITYIGAVVVGIFSGFGAYTHNMICFVSSRGNRDGGGFLSILWAILGGIIIPFIVIFICQKVLPYKSVLGWGKTGVVFHKR